MAATKQRLSYEQKLFIVDLVARRRTPSEVAQRVLAEFGTAISPQHVQKYDPTKKAGRKLSTKWVNYFFEVRRRHDAEMEARCARWAGEATAGMNTKNLPGRRPLNA